MLKLAGECIEGQMADHIASLDAHTKDIFEEIRTGEYFYNIGAGTTIALIANWLYALPLLLARDITVDRIAIEVTTAGAADTDARLGIYSDGTNIQPGALLLDAGTVDVDSIGIKEITISQVLTKGRWWLGIVSDGTPTVAGVLREYGATTGMGIASSNFRRKNGSVYVAHSYAALPDPFGSATLYNGHAPGVLVRVASLD